MTTTITTTLEEVLSKTNKHSRDDDIQFFEEGHKYIIYNNENVKYTSVTTWVHSHFEKFDADAIISKMMKGKSWKEGHKYWNMTAQQIKDSWNQNGASVSSLGTLLHFQIECFMNNSSLKSGYSQLELYENYTDRQNTIEWNYFIHFLKDFPLLKPYRTEWTIFHENLKIAGSIDMVYMKPDGTLAIYDWKRSKDITKINNFNKFAIEPCICHLPDSNFWHYALQLNIYRRILQDKYDKIVSELCLVRLHPDAKEKNYELIPVPIMDQEVDDLFSNRMCHLEF